MSAFAKMTADQFWRFCFAPQLHQRYIDTAPRGNGNRAARRAIRTNLGKDHILNAGEDIYTDRPEILKRGHLLLICDRWPASRTK